MSKYMLSDSNNVNNFNPFAQREMSLPGASRKPQEYDRHPLPSQMFNDPFETESSVMCDYAITAGSKTIDMCRPPKPNCPLSRPLIPGRNIDRGFTERNVKRNVKRNVDVFVEKACGIPKIAFLIIFLILLILIR